MLDRSTPPLTPFRAHFTNGRSMGITAATASEARLVANDEAKKRGTLVSKIKVIKETDSGRR